MKHLRYILIFLLLLQGLEAFPQGSMGFWNQQAFSGEVSLEGIFRQLKSNIGTSYEDQRSIYGIAGVNYIPTPIFGFLI